MTVIEVRPTAGRSTLRVGGAGLVVGGALQLLPMVPALLPSAFPSTAPGWQIAGWTLGGLVLVGAAVVLAIGRRGEPGIVGTSQWNRLALILSGAPGLLLAAVVIVTLSIGEAAFAWTPAAVIGTQLLVLAATSAAAIAAFRAGVLVGVARWALLALAVVDAVSVLAQLGPGVLPGMGAGLASLLVLLVVRPAILIVIGVVLALAGGRRPGPR